MLQAKPAHGYELLERFRSPAHLGRIWTMSTSQLYAVLKRLEEDGAVVGQEVEVPDAPARVEYTVTPKGTQRLEAWLYEPNPSTSIHRIRVMFLSRVYVARLLTLDLNPLIAHQERVCRKQRQQIQAERGKASSAMERLTLDFVNGQLEAALAWLNEFRKQLSAET